MDSAVSAPLASSFVSFALAVTGHNNCNGCVVSFAPEVVTEHNNLPHHLLGPGHHRSSKNNIPASVLYPSHVPMPTCHSTTPGSSARAFSRTPTLSSDSTSFSSVLIVDSGATDHMWPNYLAFTSYCPLTGRYVMLADGNHAPVTGVGSI